MLAHLIGNQMVRLNCPQVKGQARHGQSARAALTFMRIPINYPQDRTLAAEALLATGSELETINRIGEARGLYREIIVDYADTPMAVTAQERFKARP